MKIISKTTPPPSISKTPDETVLYTYSKRQWPFQTRPTAIYTKGLYQSKSIHPHPALINMVVSLTLRRAKRSHASSNGFKINGLSRAQL